MEQHGHEFSELSSFILPDASEQKRTARQESSTTAALAPVMFGIMLEMGLCLQP